MNKRDQELRRSLKYDAKTGEIRWLQDTANKKGRAGEIAGTLKKNGRRHIQCGGKMYLAHRLAWFLYYGWWPKNVIDHIDGDPLNNSIFNLRDVTRTENNRNRRMHSENKTGVNGVSWHKASKKWVSQITIDCKVIHLGCYSSIEEAAIARGAAEKANDFMSREMLNEASTTD